MIFQRGQTIVRRHRYPDGRISSVLSGRVVSDDEHGLALWVDAGSQTLHRVDAAGQPTRRLSLLTALRMTTVFAPGAWQPFRTLMLMPPGAAHSIWWSWGPDGAFEGWYVNLERPAVRWAGGVDVCDQELDLLVFPDRTWVWKDEAEFAEYTGHPAFWDEAEGAAVRAEGERILALARAGAAPFDGRLLDFRPDPAWGPTLVPHWWDLPPESTSWSPDYFRTTG
ncbi:DUF402 domain-containing protein [Longispora sp. K20-0274]|uniref:DUF402 domain-containing protein n=1 Tax=Longispora sp. K20-0274 TaxID=3088255 RepID=UPI003999C1CB